MLPSFEWMYIISPPTLFCWPYCVFWAGGDYMKTTVKNLVISFLIYLTDFSLLVTLMFEMPPHHIAILQGVCHVHRRWCPSLAMKLVELPTMPGGMLLSCSSSCSLASFPSPISSGGGLWTIDLGRHGGYRKVTDFAGTFDIELCQCLPHVWMCQIARQQVRSFQVRCRSTSTDQCARG